MPKKANLFLKKQHSNSLLKKSKKSPKMIKKYSVFWTATALEDLELIITFMAQETPSRAENWLKKIQAKAQSLSKNPKRGRLPPELIHIPQYLLKRSSFPPGGLFIK